MMKKLQMNNVSKISREFFPCNCKNCIFFSISVPGSRAELAGILSDKSFESLKNLVCEATLKGIEDMGFTHMTDIQAKPIPHLLEGK